MTREEIIKKITEPDWDNIADDLANAFEDVNNALKEFFETNNKLLKEMRTEMALEISKRMLHYAEKYTNATFVTRWYWKRKMAKMVKATEEIKNTFDEYVQQD